MAAKMIICKTCGAEIASNAKACPKCGAKNRKPIYKKWWFYALIVIILIGVIGGSKSDPVSSSSNENNSPSVTTKAQVNATPEPITYTHYNVTELFDDLNANAMKAQSTYKGQYVEIEGYLGTIDSNGKYIGLSAGDKNLDYLFQEVQCYIKTDEQKNAILEMKKGDSLIVRGKIFSVGEVLGYSLNIDSIG